MARTALIGSGPAKAGRRAGKAGLTDMCGTRYEYFGSVGTCE